VLSGDEVSSIILGSDSVMASGVSKS
jgi:hypothetical protein